MTTIVPWADKYRPNDMDSYVWRDPQMRAKTEEWIADKVLPSMLLSGPPGCGKTSLTELLMLELNIPQGDILRVNASRKRGVEELQDAVLGFVSTWALGPTGVKYILLEECDALSPTSQKFLRNEIDTYSDITRFLCTCNDRHRVIEPLRSRFNEIQFVALDRDSFELRIGEILSREGIDPDFDLLYGYINRNYPDLRKCINQLQQYTINGILTAMPINEDTTKDYLIEAIALFSEKRYLEGRKLIVSAAMEEDYPDIYRYFYRNLDLFSEDSVVQDDALLIIRNSVVSSAMAADQEILLAATLVELCRLFK